MAIGPDSHKIRVWKSRLLTTTHNNAIFPIIAPVEMADMPGHVCDQWDHYIDHFGLSSYCGKRFLKIVTTNSEDETYRLQGPLPLQVGLIMVCLGASDSYTAETLLDLP
ncbi:predicted protein [Histoplasma capsulatum G186AR]|uniref:Uncharacterized protein n=1 Tax=Ajellomyces capsulatus (strain G186AR / H82 / ATCC MYA-2454 / RMSCC 2432) TaxID=447093 RepID=C0NGQ2_AJECG|nr:uncharacterized protein HCBG_02524 [Histoplasma capsulatum G186AR]EEH08987.1 predicted protein [Histoplasma capsulatum G186AR]